jgi:hypothetical protein
MNLDNYVDVATRLKMALEKWPDLRVQETGYTVETFGDKPVLICEVRVWRTFDDPMPSIASAAEPLPGRTSFTRDSELMVGFTSALGRALGYMGIGITGSIASKNEVQNRAPEKEERSSSPSTSHDGPSVAQMRMIRALGNTGPMPATKREASQLIEQLKATKPTTEEDPF